MNFDLYRLPRVLSNALDGLGGGKTPNKAHPINKGPFLGPKCSLSYIASNLYFILTFPGILDQGQGVLILFEDSSSDQTYTVSLDAISSLGKVVDALYGKGKQLH